MNTRSRGFTLIELLVVIAIIGVLSSVVLASLNTARTRAKDAAVKTGVRQFVTLLQLEYTDTGSYAGLQGYGWDYTAANCNDSFTGTYATNARQICTNIVENAGAMYSGTNIDNHTLFSVFAPLPGSATQGYYFCMGSSGAVSVSGTPGNGWTSPGCHANP